MSRFVRWIYFCLVLALVGCGNDGGEANSTGGFFSSSQAGLNPTSGKSAPDIVVSAPSSLPAFSTKSSSLTLGGYVTSDVSEVRIEGPAGFSSVASTVSKWSFAPVVLAPGDNAFTLTASTADGSSVQKHVLITSNPTFGFSDLVPTPGVTFVEQPTPITFAINLENSPQLTTGSVHLLQVDATNVRLADLGVLNAGSANAAGLPFSGPFTIAGNAGETRFYRVSAQVGGQTLLSAPVAVKVLHRPTEAEIQLFLDLGGQAAGVYGQGLLDSRSFSGAQDATLAFLLTQPEVESALPETSGANFDVAVTFKSGLRGIISGDPAGTRGGGSNSNSLRARTLANGNTAPDALSLLVGGPFSDNEFAQTDETPGVAGLLAVNGVTPVLARGADFQFDLFKNFDRYGVVYLATHGTVVPLSRNGGSPVETVVVNTGVIATRQFGQANLADLSAGNILTVFHFPEGAPPNTPVVANVAVTPGFFTTHYAYRPLPNSLISFACCCSLHNETMWMALASVGARAFTGYTETTHSGFARANALDLYSGLQSKDLGDAFAAVFGTDSKIQVEVLDPGTGQVVKIDGLFTIAHFDMKGDPSMTISQLPRLTVDPATRILDSADSQPVVLTAAVDDFNLPNRELSLTWTTTGTLGVLRDSAGNTGTSLITTDAQVTFVPNPGLSGTTGEETVQVDFNVISLGVPGSNQPFVVTKIGSAKSKISVNGATITLLPATTTIDGTLPQSITSTVTGVPAETQLRYHWSVAGSAGGTLNDGGGQTAGTDFDSSAASVSYTPPANASDGSAATITVQVTRVDNGQWLGSATSVLTVRKASDVVFALRELLETVTFGNGRYVATGKDVSGSPLTIGAAWTSSDGVVWTRTTHFVPENSDGDGDLGNTLFSGYLNGEFVVLQSDGHRQIGGQFYTSLTRSADPTVGSTTTNLFDYALSGLTYTNGHYVGVGNSYATGNGVIVTSTDLSNWTVVVNDASNHYTSVGTGNGQVVATGTNILLSSDGGDHWTQANAGTSASVFSPVYGGGKWVAFSGTGQFLNSSDGVAWNVVATFAQRHLGGLVFGGEFKAIGDTLDAQSIPNGSAFYSSADGVSWREDIVPPRPSGGIDFQASLRGITFGGAFVAVGQLQTALGARGIVLLNP